MPKQSALFPIQHASTYVNKGFSFMSRSERLALLELSWLRQMLCSVGSL
jgi:hypothetical protein